MKIKIISNKIKAERLTRIMIKTLELIKSKLKINIQLDWEFIEEEPRYKVMSQIKRGDKIIDAYGVEWKNTKDFSIYFYEPTRLGIYNWTLLTETPQCQIAVERNFPDEVMAEIVAHEMAHGFIKILQCRGVEIEDKLDEGTDRKKLLLEALTEINEHRDKLNPLSGIAEKIKFIREKLIRLAEIINGIRGLRQLAIAMSEMEGYPIVGSRAWRNKNHLNLSYVGQKNVIGIDEAGGKDGYPNAFCIFKTRQDGLEAGENDLKIKIEGRSRVYVEGDWEDGNTLTPESTIKKLIWAWTKTDREDYLAYICNKLKIKEDFKIKNFIW